MFDDKLHKNEQLWDKIVAEFFLAFPDQAHCTKSSICNQWDFEQRRGKFRDWCKSRWIAESLLQGFTPMHCWPLFKISLAQSSDSLVWLSWPINNMAAASVMASNSMSPSCLCSLFDLPTPQLKRDFRTTKQGSCPAVVNWQWWHGQIRESMFLVFTAKKEQSSVVPFRENSTNLLHLTGNLYCTGFMFWFQCQ
jgi:hypothetical protein